jgi:Uma2 family endonuclease
MQPDDSTGNGTVIVFCSRRVCSAHAREETFAEEGPAMPMAPTTKAWTLEELHSLPDDGNKYEVIGGELFVTPPPNADHETILARLTRLLEPYVAAQGLGYLYHPRAVLRVGESEVEPDLMVRQPPPRRDTEWDDMPRPSLVVEVLSPSTSRRDRLQKRAFYLAQSIPEYWIVDPEREVVIVVRPAQEDRTVDDALRWHPMGARDALTLVVAEVFGRGGSEDRLRKG